MSRFIEFRTLALHILLFLSLGFLAGPATAQTFTLQVGSAPLPPTRLVRHGDDWRYRHGTNAPQADWKAVADAGLDATWLTGPGGFGYDDGDDATLITTMSNRFRTIYLRREFMITEPIQPGRRLYLTNDYDDAYVAWLDGMEIDRSPNAPGAIGTEPPFNPANLGTNHEASAGSGGQPPRVRDLGPASALLAPGTHTLALMGINGTLDSSDLSLITDLTLAGGTATTQDGVFFSLVNSNSTLLAGMNTFPGSTRVSVNGVDAAYDPGTGLWSRTQALEPGMNRLFIAALDAAGQILYATNRDVVCELATRRVGGRLPASEGWSGMDGTIRVTNDVFVSPGNSLFASNGLVVLISPGVHLIAETNAMIHASGSPGQGTVYFLPADGTTPWGRLGALGTNAGLLLSNVELVAGQVRAQNGGMVSLMDSVARDLNVSSRVLVEGLNGGGITVIRSHLSHYVECDSSETPTLYEDCLLEHISTDGVDLKGTNVPIIVRRCTLRFGVGSNTDAVDFGPGPGSRVEDCLIHDFGDKGVSVAANTQGTQVRNSLIFGNTFGVSFDSTTNCLLVGNTIAACQVGVNQEAGATAHVSAFGTNNIVWNNATNIFVPTNGALSFEFSDTQGGVLPGNGNISADPLFVNAATADYRLQVGSPALGSGLAGTNMGVTYPVGGIPSAPFHLAARSSGSESNQVWWQDGADNENGFAIERSMDGTTWLPLTEVGAGVTSYTDSPVDVEQTYFYRAKAINGSGNSAWSNIASARRGELITIVGGLLTSNTTWSPALGTIVVTSDVTAPTNVTLTIAPGTVVHVTNAASLRAIAGGTIEIAGTEENKVVVMGIDGNNTWGEISAQFPGASLIIRHADISRRQTTVYSNAFMFLEDSFFHDYRLSSPPAAPAAIFTQPLILTHFAQPVTVRRIHCREYHETLWRNGITVIEQSLFEQVHGDAVDLDAAQPGSVIRDCTFRHGTNGNVDAVDIGPADVPGSFDVRVENCLMYDFPFDKGVSVGDNGESHGSIVSNCLIYACRSGVMAKDLCDVSVRQCTIVMETNALIRHAWGLTNYNKVNPSATNGGGITTNTYNNIVWGNGTTLSMVNDSRLYCDHNILGHTNWPGTGNIDVDPLFLNAAQHDFRLQSMSPAFGAGRDGATLGAHFPLGAPMALSHPHIDAIEQQGTNAVLRFWADNQRTYSVLWSDLVAGGTWATLLEVPPASVPRKVTVTNGIPSTSNRFYRLLTGP